MRMTDRERQTRWRHHVIAVSHRPFDPAYALRRTSEDCDVSTDYVKAVLLVHGSITFGTATPGLLGEDDDTPPARPWTVGLDDLPAGEPCLRPQCGERTVRPHDQPYCSLDCAISDRAAA